MPRRRAYDDVAVRRGLVDVFHRTGFSATSLPEIEAATGLDRRQLYNDVGDKRAMLLRAIGDFAELAGERFLGVLEHGDRGVEDVRAGLLGLIELVDTPEGRLGCLVCNTAREPVAADPEVQAAVATYLRRIEAAYATALRRAQVAGDLAATVDDVAPLARHLLGVHVAVCVLARARDPADVIRDVAHTALDLLPTSPPEREGTP